MRSVDRSLAALAVVGQAVFTAGWLVAGLVQRGGYSMVDDDISDTAPGRRDPARRLHAPAASAGSVKTPGSLV